MLVLKRRRGEKIVIWDENTDSVIAEIQITDVGTEQVKVGVHAKPYLSIDREEVYRDKKRIK